MNSSIVWAWMRGTGVAPHVLANTPRQPHIVCVMVSVRLPLIFLLLTVCAYALTPEEISKLPLPADQRIDFRKDVQPLLESSCIKCHARGKAKGGLSLENRELMLKGGDTGPAAEPGKSGESLLIEMVSGLSPDGVMPKKGKKWSSDEVAIVRAWIDQGMQWPKEIAFSKPPPRNLQQPEIIVPEGDGEPLDRLLASYHKDHQLGAVPPVSDAQFARRASMDVTGLLPEPELLETFVQDPSPDKRRKYVRELLDNNEGYAVNWLSFWNDLLRNDYRGAGFIDGGRKQISEWLYDALYKNEPYDKFVSQLVDPDSKTEGFTSGILWRGNVTAAMRRPMQAAQCVSQVFLGINLKCASCHDSFVSDWSLADAYGMAAVFSEGPLELVECDKPTGKQSAVRFLYPELGTLQPETAREERLAEFARLLTKPEDGRFSRTIVNRLWQRVIGRGLVEPLDDMEQPAWSPEILDWLAEDFVAHKYDIKHTLEVILNSSAYQLPSVENPPEKQEYVFRGPLVRRLTAEQFADAVSSLTDVWARLPSTLEFDFSGGSENPPFVMPNWVWTDEPIELAAKRWFWRQAKLKSEEAANKIEEARKLAEVGAPNASEAESAAVAASQAASEAAQAASKSNAPSRHKVLFRKHFNLQSRPAVAFATIAASQWFEVRLNGKEVKPNMADDLANGRVRIYDFAPYLTSGENAVAIRVDSHTEKQMSDSERKQFPASAEHLNKVSGMAFYLRCRLGEKFVEFVSDPSWKVRRGAEGDWTDARQADSDWTNVVNLPPGIAPVDEGPGLEPIGRKDYANIPVELGPYLRAAVSTAALARDVRAGMCAADPLQVALDRPNREIVTSVRVTSPTTLQGLELTNGASLNNSLEWASGALAREAADKPSEWITNVYEHALARKPAPEEQALVLEALGSPVRPEGVADFLWALVMHPEFQFIN